MVMLVQNQVGFLEILHRFDWMDLLVRQAIGASRSGEARRRR